jgi:hypothetical protein
MKVVAPWVTIKSNPNYNGKWITGELRNEIRNRNNERVRLKAKGRKATEMEFKNWRHQRRTVNKKVGHAKGEALKIKAGRDIVHSGGMYNRVKEYMGWRSGGGPEMLVENQEVLRKPEEMMECLSRTYEKKLKKIENRIGKPRGDHLRTLRKMTRL